VVALGQQEEEHRVVVNASANATSSAAVDSGSVKTTENEKSMDSADR
jgi:hypothetical protein